nr:MAG TPA: zipper dimerization domain transcription factor-like protein [Caudoviricetes sp.]
MDLKQLEEEIDYLKERIANLEREKLNRTIPREVAVPFEVEIPDDINKYYTINTRGELQILSFYANSIQGQLYRRGEAFEYEEDAFAHDKEKILLKKLEDWAEEHNGDWYPNWEDCDDKYYIAYNHGAECFQVASEWRVNIFYKLPYFKSEELAREFAEEFGDEIKEVLFRW